MFDDDVDATVADADADVLSSSSSSSPTRSRLTTSTTIFRDFSLLLSFCLLFCFSSLCFRRSMTAVLRRRNNRRGGGSTPLLDEDHLREVVGEDAEYSDSDSIRYTRSHSLKHTELGHSFFFLFSPLLLGECGMDRDYEMFRLNVGHARIWRISSL